MPGFLRAYIRINCTACKRRYAGHHYPSLQEPVWVAVRRRTRAFVPLRSVNITTSPIKVVILWSKDRASCAEMLGLTSSLHRRKMHHQLRCCTLECSNISLVDVTNNFVKRAHKLVDATNEKFASFYKSLRSKYKVRSSQDCGYMHKYMIEMDLPGGMPVPIVSGHPLIDAGLREWSDRAILSTFQRCLIAAQQAVFFNEKAIEHPQATKEALFVAALRMFGGVYKPESEDDRTMPAVKLYTNHDCDDMSLCCCALAMRVAKLRVSGGRQYGAGDLINSVRPVGCYVAQGRTFQGGGHTWAALRLQDNRILHLECTQLFAPHVGSLEDNYGRGVFKERPRMNMKTDICGIKRLDPTMYATLCVLYTKDHMFIPCIGGYIASDYESFLQNKCTLEEVPIHVAPDTAICTLRATPSPKEISNLINYAPVAYQLVYGNCHPVEKIASRGKGFKKVCPDCAECFSISPANALSCA